MKQYKLDIVGICNPSEDVIGYGTKGHHDFELVKQAVLNSVCDEYYGIMKDLLDKGVFTHTWYKVLPNKGMSVEVKEGVRGAVPYTEWYVK